MKKLLDLTLSVIMVCSLLITMVACQTSAPTDETISDNPLIGTWVCKMDITEEFNEELPRQIPVDVVTSIDLESIAADSFWIECIWEIKEDGILTQTLSTENARDALIGDFAGDLRTALEGEGKSVAVFESNEGMTLEEYVENWFRFEYNDEVIAEAYLVDGNYIYFADQEGQFDDDDRLLFALEDNTLEITSEEILYFEMALPYGAEIEVETDTLVLERQ